MIGDVNQPQAWMLLAFGSGRRYEGNSGYSEQPSRTYQYDSFVPNHRQLSVGDIVFIRDKEGVYGAAKIEFITHEQGTKERRACPECGTREIRQKKRAGGGFACRFGHSFQRPNVTREECMVYIADFGNSFVELRGLLDVQTLRNACTAYNKQLAIQRVSLERLGVGLITESPEIRRLFSDMPQIFSGPRTGEVESRALERLIEIVFEPRSTAFRAIQLRRGQKRFRESLLSRYGAKCLISGCNVLDVLEAAHIVPVRNSGGDHILNGLLLRADLHTLFDLDLLGIEPDSLTVYVNESIRSSEYQQFHGRSLLCSFECRPSKDALLVRWSFSKWGMKA